MRGKKTTMKEEKVRKLIKVWYENKVKREMDPIFKFLCLWICFNAWLDHQSRKYADSQMIKWLVKQTPQTSDLVSSYERAKHTVPFKDSLKVLAQMSPIYDLRGRHDPIKIKDEDDFENIVKAIYRVRCNLFHGGKELNDLRDQKLIVNCQRILEKWVGNLIDSWGDRI